MRVTGNTPRSSRKIGMQLLAEFVQGATRPSLQGLNRNNHYRAELAALCVWG